MSIIWALVVDTGEQRDLSQSVCSYKAWSEKSCPKNVTQSMRLVAKLRHSQQVSFDTVILERTSNDQKNSQVPKFNFGLFFQQLFPKISEIIRQKCHAKYALSSEAQSFPDNFLWKRCSWKYFQWPKQIKKSKSQFWSFYRVQLIWNVSEPSIMYCSDYHGR